MLTNGNNMPHIFSVAISRQLLQMAFPQVLLWICCTKQVCLRACSCTKPIRRTCPLQVWRQLKKIFYLPLLSSPISLGPTITLLLQLRNQQHSRCTSNPSAALQLSPASFSWALYLGDFLGQRTTIIFPGHPLWTFQPGAHPFGDLPSSTLHMMQQPHTRSCSGKGKLCSCCWSCGLDPCFELTLFQFPSIFILYSHRPFHQFTVGIQKTRT